MVWAGYGDIDCGISTTCSGTFKSILVCKYKLVYV